MWAACVSGDIQAKFSNIVGKLSNGKNMPLKKNIGVINMVKKLFNVPMLGATDTSIRASDENTKPVMNATGMQSKASGE